MDFLQLSVSVYILALSPLDYVEQQCQLFVKRFTGLYGEQHAVFSIHSWLHVCQDVQVHGSLDRFMAFP